MKSTFFLICLSFILLPYLKSQAQVSPVRSQAYCDSIFKLEADNSGKIYEKPQNLPEFLGGTKALKEYLDKNYKQPKDVRKLRTAGKSVIKFTVDTDGYIKDAHIHKSIEKCKDCDAEALRLIQNMPQYLPAVQDGKRVMSYFIIPISFRYQ